jgi:hypothetical protein
MLSKYALVSALAATAAVAALLPAAAGAAGSQEVTLQAAASGVATDGAGHVHVIERATQTDAIFDADGTLDQRVALPGTAGTAGRAVTAADGSVWVAIDTPDTTGGLARVSTGGTVTSIPTSTLTSCGPAALAAAPTAIAFTASSGSGCPNGGVGTVPGTTPSMVSTTEPGGHGIAYANGSLFVSDYDDDQIHRLAPDGSVAATIGVPAGSGPDQLAVGSDGKVYVTLAKTGKLARFAPAAATGTQADLVTVTTPYAGTLGHPGGMAVGPYGDLYLLDRGGVWEIAPDGTTYERQTAWDATEGQVARAGHDLWATDPAHPRVVVLTDDEPEASIDDATSQAATATVDARGNNTEAWITATKGGQTQSSTHTYLGGTGPDGQITPRWSPELTPGEWVLTAHATNRRGTVVSAPFTLDVPDPAAQQQDDQQQGGGQPPARTGTPVVTDTRVKTQAPVNPVALVPAKVHAPAAPKFAELVKVAPATRCVSGRRVLLLTLHNQPAVRTIAWVTVKVGKGKAHKYLARELKHGLQLRRLPAHGRYKVAVTVRLANGKSYKKALAYKACGA